MEIKIQFNNLIEKLIGAERVYKYKLGSGINKFQVPIESGTGQVGHRSSRAQLY